MARNRYDDAFGVARIRWQRDEPDNSGSPVLVEVWRPTVDGLIYESPTKPRVIISARVEMRVFKDSKWWTVGWGGDLSPSAPGQIRRWALLPWRTWSQTITLDGWRKE